MRLRRSHFLDTRKWRGTPPRSQMRAPRSISARKKQDLVLSPTGLRFLGRHFPCTIGRGGVVKDKQEGDGGTPNGAHRIVGMFYRPDRMVMPTSWALPIRPGDLWCDEPGHRSYNQLARAPLGASHEHMRRSDPIYDIVLITDWNYPHSKPGRGSAIFLHRWRRPGYPTEGCIALRPDHLHWIVRRLRPGTRLFVPQP